MMMEGTTEGAKQANVFNGAGTHGRRHRAQEMAAIGKDGMAVACMTVSRHSDNTRWKPDRA
jgi:hypothetical protein